MKIFNSFPRRDKSHWHFELIPSIGIIRNKEFPATLRRKDYIKLTAGWLFWTVVFTKEFKQKSIIKNGKV